MAREFIETEKMLSFLESEEEYVSKTALKSVICKLSDDIISHALPVTIGQVMYKVNKGAVNPISLMMVIEIIIKGNPSKVHFICLSEDGGQYMYSEDDISQQVFASYDVAAKHLKEQIKAMQKDPED